MKKDLLFYETEQGKVPVRKWLSKLKDVRGKALIQTRLDRLVLGQYGDCDPLKEGMFELRIHFGPGYRLYFAEFKQPILILLLVAGTKRTQSTDVEKAIQYLRSFKKRYIHD